MATLDTPNFGLTRVGKGEDLSKGGYKALDKDRLTIDSILTALANHKHDGVAAIDAPYAAPTAVVSTSGGTLPAGQTYYYSVGYLDAYGLETAQSAELQISTTPVQDPPSSFSLTPTSGGSLSAGTYSYAVTFVQSTGGETIPGPVYTVSIDGTASQNAVIIDLPSLPGTGFSYRIYRSRPGQSLLYYITDTSTDPFTDTGISEDQTRVTPSSNTTNGFNSITVTVPGTAAAPGTIPPGVYGWRLYRTDTPGTYKGSNLVHEVIEPSTQGGTDLRISWTDDSVDLISGAPQQNNSTISTPPQLSASAFGAEEATTNLVTNPSFEKDTSSWTLVTHATPATTATRAQLNAVGGTWSVKLQNQQAGLDDYFQYQLTVSPSTVYTISAFTYINPTSATPVYTTDFLAGANGNRGLYVTDGTNIGSTTLDGRASQVGDWYRHVVTITTGSSATTLTIRLYAPQGTVYWDSVQCEQKDHATGYCDGSLGDGYAWTGTVNGSTSTRAYGSTIITKLSVLDSISTGASLYLGGKVISKGSAPSATAGSNAGTTPPAPVVASTATDVRGVITFGTGATPAAGQMVNVTFNQAYPSTPIVMVSSNNAGTEVLNPHILSQSTTGFVIGFQGAPASSQANTTYSVSYIVVG